jgi:hypothetical protein
MTGLRYAFNDRVEPFLDGHSFMIFSQSATVRSIAWANASITRASREPSEMEIAAA